MGSPGFFRELLKSGNLRLDPSGYLAIGRVVLGRIRGKDHESDEEPADGEKHDDIGDGTSLLRSEVPYLRFNAVEIFLHRREPRELVENEVLQSRDSR